ncbi:hypothetical protein JCM8547_005892 [Rhodosporidiobolus lusitaniae]
MIHDLPVELCKHIVGIVASPCSRWNEDWRNPWTKMDRSLDALSRTSKSWRELCLPFLFKTVGASGINSPAFSRLVVPLHGEHITDAILAGDTFDALSDFILSFPMLSNLAYLYVGCQHSTLQHGPDDPPAYLVRTPEYKAGEAETVTALRSAFRRITALHISTIVEPAVVMPLLGSAPQVEALKIDMTGALSVDSPSAVLARMYPVIVTLGRLTHLQHLDVDYGASELAVAAAAPSLPAPLWPLRSLSFAPNSKNKQALDFVNSFAGSLEELALTRFATDEAGSPSLFTTSFPHLRSLTLDNCLLPFLSYTKHTPSLTSLSLLISTGSPAVTFGLLNSLLPQLLDSLPDLRHLTFDFSSLVDVDPFLRLSPAATAHLRSLCTSRGIKLSSSRLFRPFAGPQEEVLWLSLDGQVSEDDTDMHVVEKAEALERVLDRARDLVRAAKAVKDAARVEQLLKLFSEVVEKRFRRRVGRVLARRRGCGCVEELGNMARKAEVFFLWQLFVLFRTLRAIEGTMTSYARYTKSYE